MSANTPGSAARDPERRTRVNGTSAMAGVPVRDGDIEPTAGLHSVAILFRVMAGMLILLMVTQVVSGATSAIDISYGVLIGEAVRLIIFAGLLWAGGDLADLFIKSHYDLRATRILVGRLRHLAEQRHDETHPAQDDAGRRGDDVH